MFNNWNFSRREKKMYIVGLNYKTCSWYIEQWNFKSSSDDLKVPLCSLCASITGTRYLHKGPFTQTIFVAQLSAISVAPKLQLQYRTCKPAAISARFYRRDIAGVSNLFETWCNFAAILIKMWQSWIRRDPSGGFVARNLYSHERKQRQKTY